MNSPTATGALFLLLFIQPFCTQLAQASSLRRDQEEGNEPVMVLTSGNTTGPLDFSSEEDSKLYVLEDIAVGDTVACITNADDGDIDLFLRFDAPPVADPDGKAGIHDCSSIEYTSEETCIVKAREEDEQSVYVLLRAYEATQNATLTCTVTPLATLVRGVPLSLSVDREHDALFQLRVEEGESVECTASGEADVDLYLHLGGIPEPSELLYRCHSTGSNNQTETCSLEPVSSDATLYVLLDAWGWDVEDATITCWTEKPMQLAREYTNITIDVQEERIYRIDVEEAANISCWANASGDLDVYMTLKESPDDSNILQLKSCRSPGISWEDELCMVDAPAHSSLFVRLAASREAVEDVDLTCAPVQEMLASGVASPELSLGDLFDVKYFVMPVEAGDWISCSLTNQYVNPTPMLQMGHNQIPRGRRVDCSTYGVLETCGYIAEDDGFAIVALNTTLEGAKNGVQCWADTGLVPGKSKPVGSLHASERMFVLQNVTKGSSVGCLATKSPGSAGDVSMLIQFDELLVFGESFYNCKDNGCEFRDAQWSGDVYVSLRDVVYTGQAVAGVEDVELTCSFIDETLTNGEVAIGKEWFQASP